MKLCLAFAASILLTLSACGGGGGEGPPAPIQVDGYGDSTTAGLHDSVTARAAVWNNRGISGSSITDLLQAWPNEEARPARLITLNHAINSVNVGVAPLTADEFRRQLTAFVVGAQGAGKRVILETPNPAALGGIHSANVDPDKLEAFAQIVREVSGATGSPLCDQNAAIHAAGMDTLEYLTDGFHPDARLYQFKAAQLAACIEANL